MTDTVRWSTVQVPPAVYWPDPVLVTAPWVPPPPLPVEYLFVGPQPWDWPPQRR